MADVWTCDRAIVRCSLVALLGLVAVGGCTSSRQQGAAPVRSADPDQLGLDELEREYQQSQVTADPLEDLNRFVFGINDRVYNGIVWPISRSYCNIVPEPIRRGVGNFFHNATTPARFVSSLLQCRFDEAGMEFGRFVVNSTVGMLGINDFAAARLGLVIDEDEDMSQAIAALGIGDGPYLVLPLLGPCSLRDGVGQLADWLMNPLRLIEPWEVYAGLATIRTINEFPQTFERYQQVTRSAVEPYTAVRQSYLEHRRARLAR